MIDPRISLTPAPTVNVGQRFGQALQNVQRMQRMPFENQLLQLQTELAQAQQPAQLMAAERAASDETQSLQGLTQEQQLGIKIAQSVKPFLDSGNDLGAIAELTRLNQQNPNLGLADDIQELQSNPEQYKAQVESILRMSGDQSLAQQRVTASKILDDGTTIQSLSTGGTNVVSPEGNILTGEDRKKALDKALKTKVEQKGAAAAAISDVKIKEAIRLEKETEKGKQEVTRGRIEIDETKIKNEQARSEAIATKQARKAEADNAVSVVSDLLSGDSFSSAFGRFNNAPPEGLRTQANIDARAKVDQVVGLLSLESRQKLKGQGTITDSEAKTLEKSATILTNPLISDDIARKELRRVQRIFEDASDRNTLKQETRQEISNQPKIIKFDAQGNIIQ